ncbi:MAG: hypothetical protein ACOYL6_18955 [Bacteriovoracaceae bacterium]
MKKLTLTILFFTTILSAHAEGLDVCYNVGSEVNMFFTTCLRGNFSKIDKILNTNLDYCINPGDEMSIFFASCVRSNFETLQKELGLELGACYNLGSSVSMFFTNCVRENFSKIEKYKSPITLQYVKDIRYVKNYGFGLEMTNGDRLVCGHKRYGSYLVVEQKSFPFYSLKECEETVKMIKDQPRKKWQLQVSPFAVEKLTQDFFH